MNENDLNISSNISSDGSNSINISDYSFQLDDNSAITINGNNIGLNISETWFPLQEISSISPLSSQELNLNFEDIFTNVNPHYKGIFELLLTNDLLLNDTPNKLKQIIKDTISHYQCFQFEDFAKDLFILKEFKKEIPVHLSNNPDIYFNSFSGRVIPFLQVVRYSELLKYWNHLDLETILIINSYTDEEILQIFDLIVQHRIPGLMECLTGIFVSNQLKSETIEYILQSYKNHRFNSETKNNQYLINLIVATQQISLDFINKYKESIDVSALVLTIPIIETRMACMELLRLRLSCDELLTNITPLFQVVKNWNITADEILWLIEPSIDNKVHYVLNGIRLFESVLDGNCKLKFSNETLSDPYFTSMLRNAESRNYISMRDLINSSKINTEFVYETAEENDTFGNSAYPYARVNLNNYNRNYQSSFNSTSTLLQQPSITTAGITFGSKTIGLAELYSEQSEKEKKNWIRERYSLKFLQWQTSAKAEDLEDQRYIFKRLCNIVPADQFSHYIKGLSIEYSNGETVNPENDDFKSDALGLLLQYSFEDRTNIIDPGFYIEYFKLFYTEETEITTRLDGSGGSQIVFSTMARDNSHQLLFSFLKRVIDIDNPRMSNVKNYYDIAQGIEHFLEVDESMDLQYLRFSNN